MSERLQVGRFPVDGLLRGRIAAVLTEAYPGKFASVSESAAEAVIEALNLKRVNRYGFHRHVTEWEPDE